MEPSVNPPSYAPQTIGKGPRSGLAVACLILGILSFLFYPLTAVPSLICGGIALAKIRDSKGRLRGKSLVLAGLLFSMAALVIFMLALDWVLNIPERERAAEDARRGQCQVNLKDVGLAFKEYAEAHGGYWPELSNAPGKLMFNMDGFHPEYLKDANLLTCPSDAQPGPAGKALESESYIYLGYVITSESELKTFLEIYRDRVAKGLPFNEDLDAPEGKGSMHKNKFYRLRKGVGKELAKEDATPSDVAMLESGIPVMWDALGGNGAVMFFNHIPGGSNILCLDGHVEFQKYPGQFPLSRPAATNFMNLRGK